MLRFLLLALVAANLLFYAFTRGWFDGSIGVRSLGDRDPGRLAAQVRPEAVRLLPMAASASAAAEGAACYQAGPVADADAASAEAALRNALPAGEWSDDRTETVGPGGAVMVGHMYRVDRADPVLAARLAALRLDPAGRSFVPCSGPARSPR